MKTIIRKIGVLAVMLQAFLAASAYDFEVNGIYYNVVSLEDLTCEVTYGDNQYSEEVVIPEKVIFSNREFSVTSIKESTFENNVSLTSISIPKTIGAIKKDTFNSCTSLQIVKLSEGIESIGDFAFAFCHHLDSISIPSSVKSIGKDAFHSSNLEKIEFHEGLEEIGDNAFSGCRIQYLSFPNTLRSLGTIASEAIIQLTVPPYVTFFGGIKSAKLKKITLEGNADSPIITLDKNIFSSNRSCVSAMNLDSVKIDRNYIFFNDNVRTFTDCKTKHLSIGKHVFSISDYYYNYWNLPKNVVIEDSETPLEIGIYVLPDEIENVYLGRNINKSLSCKNIIIGNKVTKLPSLQKSSFSAIKIPSDVYEVPAQCFKDCDKLESIVIPDKVETLKEETFFGCTSLKKVIIGKSVSSLESEMFTNSTPNIIICRNNQPSDCANNTFRNAIYLNTTLVVPKESIDLYSKTSPYSNFFTIKFAAPVSKIVFDNELVNLILYQTKKLEVEFIAEDPDAYPDVDFDLKWKSSNPEIVSVDENGNINARSIGQSVITVCSSKNENLSASISINVQKLPLTISVNNVTRLYRQENPVFTLSYSGFINGEDESVLTKKPQVSCEATPDSNCGNYEIKAFGAEAENYDISYEYGTLTIEPLTVGFVNKYNTVTYNDMSQSQSATWFDYLPEITGAYNDGDIIVTTYIKQENGKFDGMMPVFHHADSKYQYSGDYFATSGISDVGTYIYDLELSGNNTNIKLGQSRAFAQIEKARHHFKWNDPYTIYIAQNETKKLNLTYGADIYTIITVDTGQTEKPVVKLDVKNAQSNNSEWYLTGLIDGGDCHISIDFKDNPSQWGYYNFYDYSSDRYSIRVRGISDIDTIEANNLTEIGRYDLTGKPVSENYRGIVIVRYSDGSTSKTFQH